MRETLAKAVAALLTGLVVLLAAFFAEARNASEAGGTSRPPVDAAAPTSGPAVDASLVARGRAVYEAQSCSRCHSLEGRGNPRLPLDGVGARRTPDQLADWIKAEGNASGELSGSTLRAKEGFRSLPAPELEALVAYLASSR